jgi:ATP-dependent RNA helicase RhlE
VSIALQRQAAPAAGITQAAYPVTQALKAALLSELLARGLMTQALVFTRTKHRANRLFEYLSGRGIAAERIHGNRSQNQRTQALTRFKSGRCAVLVATDLAARGIDVTALSHVVNFDVPAAAEDYIHRVGRTGRAELTGEAFTFVAPDEEADLRTIERAVHTVLPRVTLPDFDYRAAAPQLELSRTQRLARHRRPKAPERAGTRTPRTRFRSRRPGGRGKVGPPS